MAAKKKSIVDSLDDWRVRGSQGQPVQAPEIASLLSWRSRLPDEESDGAMTRRQLARHAARVRWGNRGRG